MADLAHALHAALRDRFPREGVKSAATTRRGLTARMNQLEKQYTHPGDRKGSAGIRAAKAAGISPRTWQKWRAGTQAPSAKLLSKLQAAYNKVIVEPKFRRKVNKTGAPKQVNVTADVRWNGYLNRPNSHRTVKLVGTGIANAMRATIRAWHARGPEAAADVFQRGMATAHNVPNTDDEPGILFEGNDVEIEFP